MNRGRWPEASWRELIAASSARLPGRPGAHPRHRRRAAADRGAGRRLRRPAGARRRRRPAAAAAVRPAPLRPLLLQPRHRSGARRRRPRLPGRRGDGARRPPAQPPLRSAGAGSGGHRLARRVPVAGGRPGVVGPPRHHRDSGRRRRSPPGSASAPASGPSAGPDCGLRSAMTPESSWILDLRRRLAAHPARQPLVAEVERRAVSGAAAGRGGPAVDGAHPARRHGEGARLSRRTDPGRRGGLGRRRPRRRRADRHRSADRSSAWASWTTSSRPPAGWSRPASARCRRRSRSAPDRAWTRSSASRSPPS